MYAAVYKLRRNIKSAPHHTRPRLTNGRVDNDVNEAMHYGCTAGHVVIPQRRLAAGECRNPKPGRAIPPRLTRQVFIANLVTGNRATDRTAPCKGSLPFSSGTPVNCEFAVLWIVQRLK